MRAQVSAFSSNSLSAADSSYDARAIGGSSSVSASRDFFRFTMRTHRIHIHRDSGGELGPPGPEPRAGPARRWHRPGRDAPMIRRVTAPGDVSGRGGPASEGCELRRDQRADEVVPLGVGVDVTGDRAVVGQGTDLPHRVRDTLAESLAAPRGGCGDATVGRRPRRVASVPGRARVRPFRPPGGRPDHHSACCDDQDQLENSSDCRSTYSTRSGRRTRPGTGAGGLAS